MTRSAAPALSAITVTVALVATGTWARPSAPVTLVIGADAPSVTATVAPTTGAPAEVTWISAVDVPASRRASTLASSVSNRASGRPSLLPHAASPSAPHIMYVRMARW
ncbi:MAG: hypothetical protein R2939_07435 [Kofleriaceae bacterium]